MRYSPVCEKLRLACLRKRLPAAALTRLTLTKSRSFAVVPSISHASRLAHRPSSDTPGRGSHQDVRPLVSDVLVQECAGTTLPVSAVGTNVDPISNGSKRITSNATSSLQLSSGSTPRVLRDELHVIQAGGERKIRDRALGDFARSDIETLHFYRGDVRHGTLPIVPDQDVHAEPAYIEVGTRLDHKLERGRRARRDQRYRDLRVQFARRQTLIAETAGAEQSDGIRPRPSNDLNRAAHKAATTSVAGPSIKIRPPSMRIAREHVDKIALRS